MKTAHMYMQYVLYILHSSVCDVLYTYCFCLFHFLKARLEEEEVV